MTLRAKIWELQLLCEAENDFWPNSRVFLRVGEIGLAFEGIYLYLLDRDDLWQKHHALIKSIKRQLTNIDFDALELRVLDNGRYCETIAMLHWREAVTKEFDPQTEYH